MMDLTNSLFDETIELWLPLILTWMIKATANNELTSSWVKQVVFEIKNDCNLIGHRKEASGKAKLTRFESEGKKFLVESRPCLEMDR